MAYSSGKTITCIVHGDDSPYSGAHHDPTIKLKFTATISRSGDTVSVKLSGMKFWVSGPGGYGYPMSVYAMATAGSSASGSWTKLAKSSETKNVKWTINPSNKTVSCTNKTTTVYVQIGAYSSDKKHCYGSSTKKIAAYAFTAPPPNYTITYNANGGQDAPAAQAIPFASPTANLLGDDTHPKYPVTVNYYQIQQGEASLINTETPAPQREFLFWNTKADGTGTDYSRNAEYTATANATLYAKWGNATFICDTPPATYYGVTFNPLNGTPNIYKDILRRSVYNTKQDGSGTDYIPETTCYTDASLDLYAIYGSAYLYESDLPTGLVNPGYVFDCWCSDATLQNPIQYPYEFDGPIVLYARWNPLPIHRLNDNKKWESPMDYNPYVWQCVEENGTKVWKQIAHVYRCVEDSSGKHWKDMSEQ